jgi:hypothetical protein
MCKSRLKGIVKKLAGLGLLKEYDDVFRDQLGRKFIEEVPVAEEYTAKHFLPHFPVIREDRVTTKTRIVFDPSKTSSRVPCLNDLLDKGPSHIPLLTTILIRFRLYPVGIIADRKGISTDLAC